MAKRKPKQVKKAGTTTLLALIEQSHSMGLSELPRFIKYVQKWILKHKPDASLDKKELQQRDSILFFSTVKRLASRRLSGKRLCNDCESQKISKSKERM